MVRKIFPYVIFMFVISSCDNWILPEEPTTEPLEVFDSLWEDVNERYSFSNTKT